MTAEELRTRTNKFALRVIRLTQALPKTNVASVLGKQLLRSATSVGANYRAACRARSQAEFFAKLSIVVEESDETVYWLELIAESDIIAPEKLSDLLKEANELTAIFATSRKTAKQNR